MLKRMKDYEVIKLPLDSGFLKQKWERFAGHSGASLSSQWLREDDQEVKTSTDYTAIKASFSYMRPCLKLSG